MDSSVSAKSIVLADSLAQSQNSQLNKGTGIERSQKRTLLIWLLLGLLLPLLSMLPFLYLQGKKLIDQQSFLFFPLTTAVGVWLLARTCDYRPASRRRARLAVVLACSGMGLTVLGIFFISPWIVQVAMVIVIFAWSLRAFGGSEWTRVVAICSLFAVSVPLPSGLDGLINLRLQSVSSWACSGFLDAISVPNIVEGNVLQIQEKKLSVSEVCRGPDSLFALIALGLLVVVVRRCSFLVSLITLLSIPFCFVIGISIRLLIVALGFEYFGADLSTGVGHIGTSVIVFAGSVACVILLHISIKAILDPVSRKVGSNNLTLLYQRVATWPQMIESSSSIAIQATEDNHYSSGWRRVSQLLLGLCCFACLVFGALSAYAIFSVGKNDALTGAREELAATFPPQDVFPDQLGNLRKTSFSPTKQSETNVRGKYSHLWRFDDRGSQVVVSLDFPFQGWRPLWAGYQSFGWKIVETKPVKTPVELGASWTVEEFKMQNQYGLFGFVWYAFFDENGNPTSRANESEGTSRTNIFNSLKKKPSEGLVTCFQVQLFLESGKDLSEAEIEQNRKLFFEVYERIRQQSVTALKKAK